MSLELIYTSAPRGLKPGARGFCTVAHTAGMPAEAVDLCESLSGYPPLDPRAAFSPPAISHRRATLAGRTVSVLSRVAPCGADYSGRPNTLAHHLLLADSERQPAGPADLALLPNLFTTAWEGEPRLFPGPRALPATPARFSFEARAWQQAAGDPAWAAVLAQAYLDHPSVPAFLVYEPDGFDPLPLLAEALALLRPDQRWQVTFTTYAAGLPAGATCVWRGCLPESEALLAARRFPDALVLTLAELQRLRPPENSFSRAARGLGPPPWAEAAARPAATFGAVAQPAAASAPDMPPEPTNQVLIMPPRPTVRPDSGQARYARLQRLGLAAAAALALALLGLVLAGHQARTPSPPTVPGLATNMSADHASERTRAPAEAESADHLTPPPYQAWPLSSPHPAYLSGSGANPQDTIRLLRLTAETSVLQDTFLAAHPSIILAEIWMQPGFSLASISTNFRGPGDALSGGGGAALTYTLRTRCADAQKNDSLLLRLADGRLEFQPPVRSEPVFALRLAGSNASRILVLSSLALPPDRVTADPASRTFTLDFNGLGASPTPLVAALAVHTAEFSLDAAPPDAMVVLRRFEPETGRVYGEWSIPEIPAPADTRGESTSHVPETPKPESVPTPGTPRLPPLSGIRWRGHPLVTLP